MFKYISDLPVGLLISRDAPGIYYAMQVNH